MAKLSFVLQFEKLILSEETHLFFKSTAFQLLQKILDMKNIIYQTKKNSIFWPEIVTDFRPLAFIRNTVSKKCSTVILLNEKR